MSEPFCHDCPDHEACATGWPCAEVKRVDERVRKSKQVTLEGKFDHPLFDARWLHE